jgi:hypothetical protein
MARVERSGNIVANGITVGNLVAGDLYANVARFGNVVTEYIINEYTITSDTNITAAGTITGQSIVSNTSITANANITANGSISAVGNISASYLIASNSIIANGQIIALGNITGSYVFGNIPATSIVAGIGSTSGVGGALDSLFPSGEISGYVLTTSGPGSYFWSNATGGGGGSIGTKIDTQRQSNTATAGQTVFNLGGGINYTPGSGQLRVYIDGVRQFPDAYTETSNVSFTLSEGVIAGTPVLAEIDGYVSYPIAASDISYAPAGGSSIEGITVQTAVTELEVEKAPKANPGLSGNVGINVTNPYGNLDVAGTINGRFPGWITYIDSTSGGRTSPGTFTKSGTGFLISAGDITFFTLTGGSSILWEMKVYAPGDVSVTQYLSAIDDNVYFVISGGTGASTVSPASSLGAGAKNTTVTWNLTAGVNLIQILWNNSGGGNGTLQIFGDFFYRYPTLKFVYP